MLADSRWPYHVVSEQHSRRCEVTTTGRPLPRWAAVAQGGVGLRMHIRGWSRPLAPFDTNTLLVSPLVYAWPIMHSYARWLATAVPRRKRAARSSLWNHNGGAAAATVGRSRSRGSRPSYAYKE